MKTYIKCILLSTLLVSNVELMAFQQDEIQFAQSQEMTCTERKTDAEVLAARLLATEAKTVGEKSGAPSQSERVYNIVEMSDFIAFDEFSTLVPKGAILSVPDSFRPNMITDVSGTLILWNEFLNRNRARISPFEITIEQAAGVAEIDPKLLRSAIATGSIIVAVIRGNPTSVSRPADSTVP